LDFHAIARACEIYTFRMHAAPSRYRKDMNAGGVNRLANHLLRRNKDADYVVNHLCGWLAQWASLREFVVELAKGGPQYHHDPETKGWSHCYYFLYEYEIWASPKGVSPLPWATRKEHKVTTQEHILPQGHRGSAWWSAH